MMVDDKNLQELAAETITSGREYEAGIGVGGSGDNVYVRFGKDRCLYFPIAVVNKLAIKQGDLFRIFVGSEGNIALLSSHDAAISYRMRSVTKGQPHIKLSMPMAAIEENNLEAGMLYDAQWVDAVIEKKKERVLLLTRVPVATEEEL